MKIIISSLIIIVSFLCVNLKPALAVPDYSIPTIDQFRVLQTYNKKITVRWKKITDSGVNFYQVKTYRERRSGKLKWVTRNRTKDNNYKKTLKNLSPGYTYYFKARACRTKLNCGPWSEKLRATTDTPPPVVKNLIVNFKRYSSTTDRAGAFDFASGYNEDKLFYEFGAVVPTGSGGYKMLPTFEYRTGPNARVYSPVNGTIQSAVFQNSTNDYELIINKYEGNDVQVYIDHVKSLQVSEGDEVKAGDFIGRAGTWTSSLGRVELMVASSEGYECPFNYFDPDLKDEYEDKILQHMEDWEDYKGDNSIYDEDSMTVAAGCAYDRLQDDELEL